MSNNPIKKPSARHYARIAATQLIYSWQQTNEDPQIILFSFMTDFIDKADRKLIDRKYMKELFEGVTEHDQAITESIVSYLDRGIIDLGLVELAILKYSFYELLNTEIPYQVIINEAIEVCKNLGAENSYQAINACLDKARKVIRSN